MTEITYTPFTGDAEARANLELLWLNSPATLESNPLRMRQFVEGDFSNSPVHKADCGTAACYAGRGPLCGIEPKLLEDWEDYSQRLVGDNDEWHYLFSPRWPNDLEACRTRTRILLDKGLPSNWLEQMEGGE
jgi:hypothetical protein